MKFEIDFDTNKAAVVKDNISADIPLSEILSNISDSTYFDSGIMPVYGTGLVSYRQGFGRVQLVYQIEPQIHRVAWGEYESEAEKPQYMLAEPWKIIIADFQNDSFLGLRHFYAFSPVYDYDLPLYAINLPNTNTIGYGGTSVGWVCLYLRDQSAGMTLAEKINYIVERESGANEPYNNANMSSTDGPRFYQNRQADKSIWDPQTWAERTQKEGVDWICDPNLFAQIKIDWAKTPDATAHDDSGEPYKLSDAMYRNYYPYYSNRGTSNPPQTLMNIYHQIAAEGKNPYQDPDFVSQLAPLWRTGKNAVATKQKLTLEQILSKLSKVTIQENTKQLYLSDGIICPSCQVKKPANERFRPVTISYQIDCSDEPQPLIERIKSYKPTVTEQWCRNCIDSKAVKIAELGYAHPIASWNLVYSSYSNSFHIPQTSVSCPRCGSYYPTKAQRECMVVDSSNISDEVLDNLNNAKILNQNNYQCCINCIHGIPNLQLSNLSSALATVGIKINTSLFVAIPKDIENYVQDRTDDTENENAFWKFVTSIAEIENFDPNSPNQIKTSVVENYIPVKLAKHLGLAICPCNVFSNNTEVCDICVDEENVYTPVFETLVKISNQLNK